MVGDRKRNAAARGAQNVGQLDRRSDAARDGAGVAVEVGPSPKAAGPSRKAAARWSADVMSTVDTIVRDTVVLVVASLCLIRSVTCTIRLRCNCRTYEPIDWPLATAVIHLLAR